MNVAIITQARVGSTRLPSKVLMKIQGRSLLEIHLARIKKSQLADTVIVATTLEDEALAIVDIADKMGVDCYRGSMNDVLDRFYQAAKDRQLDYVVRLTSDCPLIDPLLIDQVIQATIDKGVDYGANILEENYPDGQDIEVIQFSALEKAWHNAIQISEREHVTPFIRNNCNDRGKNMFSSLSYPSPVKMNHIRMTIDEQSDFDMMKIILSELGSNLDWQTYANYIIENQSRFSNQQIIRNEGYLKSLAKDEKKDNRP